MIKNQKIILKIFLYCLSGFALIAILAYFLFGTKNLNNYLSILISAAISIFLFMLGIFIYRKISNGDMTSMLKYMFVSFFGKLILLASVFYLFAKTDFINITYFLVSFIIFFTIFLNIEIFLIYRKNIFIR